MQETKVNKVLDVICRWFVGLVFLFSSFVKGVDPMGTAFKIQEYMTAWSIGGLSFEWAQPLAVVLSMMLITAEFTVGVLLITKSWRKFTGWLLALMMLFFTITTLVDAITNKVTDCGCFGDFVKLTNWETFGKNVILDIPTLFIFLCRRWKNKKRRFSQDLLIAIVAVAAMVIFGLWNIKNEPCLDFRAWKVGNQMIPFGEDLEVQSFVTYRNTQTGEIKEFPSTQLMEFCKDTAWMSAWEFVDSRVVDPYEIQADGFSMVAPDGDDYAKDIIGNANYVLIGTIHHLKKVDEAGVRALKMIHNFCVENGVNFVLLTSALPEDVQSFLYAQELDELVYYFADATAIETMLRSNPGFLLVKDAKVLGKWSLANAAKITEYPFLNE